ncbi:PadR family transcriptional regulator [Angustibacter aerolatus]
MSPVFAHGQLRLYLLVLLAEAPRHGYEVIRALEERFEGLYAPSAGTVYPRLARLEEEGLVTREDEGRKAVYRITDAGRAEVAARRSEVDELEVELTHSLHRMADQVRQQVRGSAQELRAELADAAREARRTARDAGDGRQRAQRGAKTGPGWADVETSIADFRLRARGAVRSARDHLDEDTVRRVQQALDDALGRIDEALAGRDRPTPPTSPTSPTPPPPPPARDGADDGADGADGADGGRSTDG